VDKIMPTFVMQPGVPVVTVHQSSCQNNQSKTLLEQQRFFVSPNAAAKSSSEQWEIPVCIKTGNPTSSSCTVLSSASQELSINGCASWVFANRDAKGYYRALYDPQNFARMAAAAESSLTASERIALVEDTWAMTRAGKYPIELFMHLALAMRSERERLVVNSLSGHLEYAGSLVPPGQKQQFKSFLRAQFTPLAKELGWEVRPTDTSEQKALRASLLDILGEAGDPGAIAAAQKMVQQYLRQPGSTDPTLTGAAFSVAAENGTPELYATLSSALDKARSTDEYYSYLFSVTSFPQPELVQKTLQLLDQGKVRHQDYPSFFGSLLANDAAREETWTYLKSHWDDLAEKISSFGGRGAVSALSSFCSEKDRDDVKQFFASHRAPGAERAVQQSLESIGNCIDFKHLQQANMEKWLASE